MTQIDNYMMLHFVNKCILNFKTVNAKILVTVKYSTI